ncbi:hypothetical protein Glove_327g36 [Diversispora epigaea]|uniref:Uncharacterized protein n=1 Tax=Diversispora epigaea TaxID=1348612 RepID=A0A397HRQ7_9GLOM|nr:hypothetical protein Glove_327g36 [Diversispora epigaea]
MFFLSLLELCNCFTGQNKYARETRYRPAGPHQGKKKKKTVEMEQITKNLFRTELNDNNDAPHTRRIIKNRPQISLPICESSFHHSTSVDRRHQFNVADGFIQWDKCLKFYPVAIREYAKWF